VIHTSFYFETFYCFMFRLMYRETSSDGQGTEESLSSVVPTVPCQSDDGSL